MGILLLVLAELHRNFSTESIYSTILSSPCSQLESGRILDKQALNQEVCRKGNFPINKRSQWDGSKRVRLRMSFSNASNKAGMSKFAQILLNQGLIEQSVGPRQFKILCTPPLKFLFLSCVYVNVVVTLTYLLIFLHYVPSIFLPFWSVPVNINY